MTVKTNDRLDLEAFRRAYEEWNIQALLDLYADDVELVQIDRDHPPSSPRVRHGREVLSGIPSTAVAGLLPAPRPASVPLAVTVYDDDTARPRLVDPGVVARA